MCHIGEFWASSFSYFPEFNFLCFHKAIETYGCDSAYIYMCILYFAILIKYFIILKY